MRPKTGPKHRIHLELTPRQYAILETLRGQIESPSHAETIRQSITICSSLVEELRQGRRLMIKRPDGTTTELCIVHLHQPG